MMLFTFPAARSTPFPRYWPLLVAQFHASWPSVEARRHRCPPFDTPFQRPRLRRLDCLWNREFPAQQLNELCHYSCLSGRCCSTDITAG